MQVALEQIVVKPGQQLLLQDISWSDFEEILSDLGEHRGSRIAYSNGALEIMVPLPEHEKHKEVIGDLVKILLDYQETDFESLASTTFKSPQMNQALEADACVLVSIPLCLSSTRGLTAFYIQNHQAVIGKDRLDLTVDPPPDLAIEIDITNRTKFDNYLLLRVPELWRYSRQGLKIYFLQDRQYIESQSSPHFPALPIIELIERHTKQAQIEGRSRAIRSFRQWIKQNLPS